METVETLAAKLVNNHARIASFGWRAAPADAENWTIIYTVSRDSSCLARANAEVFAAALDPFCTGEDAADCRAEHHGHWACGWSGGYSIRVFGADGQITPAFRAYAELELSRQDYPSLDDDRLCALEHEEADRIWSDCYNVRDRIAYIRKAPRGEFEFESLSDMLGCVRGKYFAGYASELVNR